MSRKIKTFFTVSILLNVLLFGALGGIAVGEFSDRPWHRMAEDLKPETQNVLARTFQKSHNEAKAAYQEMKAAKEELSRIFSARNFDAEAYKKAVERMRAAREKVMEERFEAMMELGAELPQSERKKIAEQFSKRFGEYRHHGKKPRMFDHPPAPAQEKSG